MSNIEIIPAILPKNFEEVSENASLVKGLVKTVQVDICDGQFVPNITWPLKRDDEYFARILQQQEGLPFWDELDYEFDLMVNWHDPKRIEDWVQAGATRIILHVESKGDLLQVTETVFGQVEIGLALNIDTPIDVLEPFKDKIQFIQLMGIDRVGFQGQPFDPKVIDKIKQVKSKYPEFPISIDGAVSLATAKDLIRAGATRLVVGSAIFDSENIAETIEQFKELV